MPSRTRLLVALLGLLLAVTAWVYLVPGDDSGPMSGPGGASPAMGPAPLRRSPAPAKPSVEHVEELRVAALMAKPRDYSPGRDPWRFVEPPPPPPPAPPKPRVPTEEELRQMREAQEALRRQQEAEAARIAAQEAIPKPPPFTLSYVGNFGPAQRRIAVFTDGNDIINAQEGEVIAGKFIVARIGYESVDIRFVGFPQWPAQRLAVGNPEAGEGR